MTVAELREMLTYYPDDAKVVVAREKSDVPYWWPRAAQYNYDTVDGLGSLQTREKDATQDTITHCVIETSEY